MTGRQCFLVAAASNRRARLIGIGTVLILSVWIWSHANRPTAAPPAVQQTGRLKVQTVIDTVRASPFGRRERGRWLSEILQRQLDRGGIVFSGDMGGPRGQTRPRWFRVPVIYIRVIPVNESTYLHQLDWQLAEALYHEAVHVFHGGFGRASFEEECDAFCAGLEAEAIVRGVPSPPRLVIDDMSVAEFVAQAYPNAPRRPNYRPVGADMAWLRERVGIDAAVSDD